MKRPQRFIAVLIVALLNVTSVAEMNWTLWNAEQFPESFQGGDVFISAGSGSREIVSLPAGDSAYRCVADTAGEGYSFTTKPAYWTNADSTIDFHLKIDSYNASKTKAMSVKIIDAQHNWLSGFTWTRQDGIDLIQAAESSAITVEFANLGLYATYRIIYSAAAKSCALYYWNQEDQRWRYLLKSQGYGSGATTSELFIGDNSYTTAADWQISYLSWTNDGVPKMDYVLPEARYYAYDASLGLLPDQADPTWTKQYYNSVTAQMTLDSLTGEDILLLNHSATAQPETFRNFSLSIGPQNNAADDFITFEMRFRLLDAGTADQMGFWIRQPPNPRQIAAGATEQDVHVRFYRSGVRANTESGYVDCPLAVNNDWHIVRLTFDVRKANVSLFMDNNPIPLASYDAVAVNSGLTRSQILFGDGSSSITGRAAIAWLRWTTDAAEIPLAGGQLALLDNTVLTSEPLAEDHLNFAQAYRWADGTYWLHYSIGDHIDPSQQTTGQLISRDGGMTWHSPGFWVLGRNAWQFDDGSIIGIGLGAGDPQTTHTVGIYRWASPLEYLGYSTSSITLPWSIGSMHAERRIVKMPDGRFLLTVQGIKQGDTRWGTFVIHSTDQGQTWSYLSTVSFDQSVGTEGYNEPVIVLLPNGNLLCLMRTGSPAPMYQSISSDGGYTWTTPVQVADSGVYPEAIVLQDGTLVVSSGRPGVYLMVDFTGTGSAWQQIRLYDGGPYPYWGGGYDDDTGCSYTSLAEVQPNVVMLFYTESGLSGQDLPDYALPNTIRATYFRIRRNTLPGDFNNDGVVNLLDFANFSDYWQGGAPATFGAGIMDLEELAQLAEYWLQP